MQIFLARKYCARGIHNSVPRFLHALSVSTKHAPISSGQMIMTVAIFFSVRSLPIDKSRTAANVNELRVQIGVLQCFGTVLLTSCWLAHKHTLK